MIFILVALQAGVVCFLCRMRKATSPLTLRVSYSLLMVTPLKIWDCCFLMRTMTVTWICTLLAEAMNYHRMMRRRRTCYIAITARGSLHRAILRCQKCFQMAPVCGLQTLMAMAISIFLLVAGLYPALTRLRLKVIY